MGFIGKVVHVQPSHRGSETIINRTSNNPTNRITTAGDGDGGRRRGFRGSGGVDGGSYGFKRDSMLSLTSVLN